MQLRSYSEHTQLVYGRVVREFLSYTGKDVKILYEHDVRNYVLHLMKSGLNKRTINCYQAAIRFFFWRYFESLHELLANASDEDRQSASGNSFAG